MLLLGCLDPASACAIRTASRMARRSIDIASQLLLMSRLFLTAAPDGFPPALALSTSWRARRDASDKEIAIVALLCAERGFLSFLRGLRSRIGLSRMLSISNNYGVTLLHAAASAGQAAVCTVLCQFAAEAHNPPGWKGVMTALSQTTSRKRSVLHSAAAGGSIHVVEAILAALPSQEIYPLLSSLDCRRRSCALVAAHQGWMVAAHRLIEAHWSFSATKASVSESDVGSALLVHASEVDDHALASAVLRKDADPNRARGTDKVTPLGAAAAHGSFAVLQLLLEQPMLLVDLVEGAGGRSALHLACQSGHDAVVEALLRIGANPRLEAPGGRTPLYFAAESGSMVCVEALLKYGGLHPVDALHMTVRSLTPMSVAQRRGHIAVADYLAALTMDVRLPSPRKSWIHTQSCASPRLHKSNGSSDNLQCFDMSPRTPPRTPRASSQSHLHRPSRPCSGSRMVRSLILVAERVPPLHRPQPKHPPPPPSCSRSRTASPRRTSPSRIPNLADLQIATPRRNGSRLQDQLTKSTQPQYTSVCFVRSLGNVDSNDPGIEVVSPPQHTACFTPRHPGRATPERPPRLPGVRGAFGGA